MWTRLRYLTIFLMTAVAALFLALWLIFEVVGYVAAAPAVNRAETPVACDSTAVAERKIGEANGGAQPVKRLAGKAADELGKRLGLEFAASHILIYVTGTTVYVFAFEAGCAKAAGNMPLMLFLATFPGVLGGE